MSRPFYFAPQREPAYGPLNTYSNYFDRDGLKSRPSDVIDYATMRKVNRPPILMIVIGGLILGIAAIYTLQIIAFGGSALDPDMREMSVVKPKLFYGIVIDCGSSGSRVFVYQWAQTKNPEELLDIHEVKQPNGKAAVYKVEPGLSSYAGKPLEAYAALKPLLEFAASNIPVDDHSSTQLFVLATAGMRLISKTDQEAIMQAVLAGATTDFAFAFVQESIEVISGTTEGIYGWIAVNYALNRLSPHREVPFKINTAGVIDMGGGSVQMTTEVPPSLSMPPEYVVELNLGCQESHHDHYYRLYTATHLGFGANEARRRYDELLIKLYMATKLSSDSNIPSESSLPALPVVVHAPETEHSLPPVVELFETLQDEKALSKTAEVVLNEHRPDGFVSLVTTPAHGVDGGSQATVDSSVEPLKSLNLRSHVEEPGLVASSGGGGGGGGDRRTLMSLRGDDSDVTVIVDPCSNAGYQSRTTLNSITYLLEGSGDFEACRRQLIPVLEKDAICALVPCSFSGVFQPQIDFSGNEFYGLSEFWYTTSDVFGIHGPYDRLVFDKAARSYCSTNWTEITANRELGKYPRATDSRLRSQCFKAAWLSLVLHDGYGAPSAPTRLTTAEEINGKYVSWTLGAILYLTRFFPLRADAAATLSDGRTRHMGSFVEDYLLLLLSLLVLIIIAVLWYNINLNRKNRQLIFSTKYSLV